LAQQIAQMKLSLGYGQYANQTQGQASSGWGLGTSPYAVNPAPAEGANQVEDRQGDASQGDTVTTTFEPLYAPTDSAHGFSSENQLHGQIDLTQTPKKVEEVRSAPETQAALVDYANIIGAYAEGDEAAVSRESVPLEYQELVKLYFEQLAKDAGNNSGESGASGGGEEPEPDGG
jgi:hypothetical protein